MMHARRAFPVRPTVLGRLAATLVVAAASTGITATAMATDQPASIRIAPPFGDGMVLPMDRAVPLRGGATPGDRVTVRVSWTPDRLLRTQADDRGRWTVTLPPGPAGGPHTITLRGGTGDRPWSRTIEDVLLGTVWLAGGQSNMQMTLAPGSFHDGVRHWPDEIARADAPRVRMFDVPRAWSWTAADTFAEEAGWTAVTPATAGSMSAVAWFFAEQVHRERGVPVGIVHASYGGTRIEAWMSEAVADQQPSLAPWLEAVRAERRTPGSIEQWRTERARAATQAVEDRDPGFRDGWMRADVDDGDWPEVRVGEHWAAAPLSTHDGYVWMRRTVTLPANAAETAWTLHLGAVDDRDITWINGVEVGRTEGDGQWNEPRRYPVPAGGLRPGRNLIAVRVHDTSGPGGMIGPSPLMRLVPQGAGEDAAISIAGAWRFRPTLRQSELTDAATSAAAAPPPARSERNFPTVLHNAMLAPMTGFPVDGVIFYQGESNVGDSSYHELLPALIGDWRAAFGDGGGADVPFLLVQIAPFRYGRDRDAAAWLREAQRRTTAELPGVELVVTTDLGSPHDIHPMDKRPIGERLARLALAFALETGDEAARAAARSPQPVSFSFRDGGAVVRFAATGGGLVVRGAGPPTHWQVRAADGPWRTAQASIAPDGRGVRVVAKDVAVPVAVRFGWGPAPAPNLFGGHGLPVVPFTSEAAQPIR